ncbi:glycine cleavage T-protein (aminomethyl transferase) domain-containing protein [Cardiosporidium cionae]|uniref:Glycine cleavage T-protein (Aminomethyl transferase) domain-containing protein n=1 Tax=Cardiosporidium cionae TaxID=476202 RepID=A0ABQ7JEQ3_9APIC|nr:glycine cleavage T-protein (aminomethyl transferase) domain-containing protein [Cardiosporidium cionae]|eukprot:KAF8822486.1 glycine cleavage T-protein (aminomethyl transferase) domain-containing protein [Cardiosporidium cionae]
MRMDVDMELQKNQSLIALQGPESMDVLQNLVPSEVNLTTMPFMTGLYYAFLLYFFLFFCKYLILFSVTAITTSIDSVSDCVISRCGYTGEDGFEISVANDAVERLSRKLASHPVVKLAGLGARDSLRLESGFCLYGHDIDETTSPIEAALGWTIGKRRRLNGGFLGADTIAFQLKEGVRRKRVGLVITDKAPPKGTIWKYCYSYLLEFLERAFSVASLTRYFAIVSCTEGAKIFDSEGEEIGVATSSVFSPSLQRPIAMGYVLNAFSKVGTQIKVDVRGKMRSAEVVKMPFVAASFYKVP